MQKVTNRDAKTIDGFGDEWNRFDQQGLKSEEHLALFNKYFAIFPWEELPVGAVGFDMGCGSGRWAKLVAPRVGKLHCIDPSSALEVARANLGGVANCEFHHCGVGEVGIDDGTLDFGYSLGVLHHVPDTEQGIRDCVKLLKPGGVFLLYLYYAFDNRSAAYRALWLLSDIVRRFISRQPHGVRYFASQCMAFAVYWPLARCARLLEKLGASADVVAALPLSFYRKLSFYTMRTDALDRFGTSLEQRFTRDEISRMMEQAGLTQVAFSRSAPFWCAVGYRAA
jgi:SAM-dependent methyltransferase